MRLTRPSLEMIQAPTSQETKSLVAEGGKLVLSTRDVGTSFPIQDMIYDDTTGKVTIYYTDGRQQTIGNFPIISQVPEGPKGPDGEPGIDGKPGKDGRDGRDGEVGCPGPQGEQGPPGEDGRDGMPGGVGPQGAPGCPGPMGAMGPTGPTGPTGKPGPTGPTGAPGPAGPKGERGPAGKINIVISEIDPGTSLGPGGIWINPSIGQVDADLDQFFG